MTFRSLRRREGCGQRLLNDNTGISEEERRFNKEEISDIRLACFKLRFDGQVVDLRETESLQSIMTEDRLSYDNITVNYNR